MAITLAVGTQVAIASAYGASKAMSAISNAAEAVATLEASHGVVENDIIEITSGWQRLNSRIVRADSVATNDVTLEDIDTSSTSRYPSGSGTGSVREITTWQNIGQLTRDFQITAGEQQFTDITTLDDVIDQEIPTRRSPVRVGLPLYFDPTQAYVPVVRTASETATLTAVRFTFPNGTKIYANAYWSFLDLPTIEGETLRGRIDLAIRGLTTLYTT
jgi:hypothetical protein